MTDKLFIPHDALILVADARKALILTNAGTPAAPRLEIAETLEAPANPPDRDQSSDRPGRVFKTGRPGRSGGGVERRAAVGQTDRHDLAERRFAETVAAAFGTAADAAPGARLALVAAPATLAALRDALPQALRGRVFAEVAKDLTNHPPAAIQKALSEA